MRIVSLLPSATEMLCALGLDDQLVGISHGCDYPESISGLPRVTSTAIPKDASSLEIDRLVRERHAAGLPLYELDHALLKRLDPQLLVSQGLCDVCAVATDQARAAIDEACIRAEVISLAPTTLSDVLANILELGAATGTLGRAQELVGELEERVERVRRRVEGRARPRVTLLEWVDPPYAAGHWTPELVTLAGGQEGHGRPGARSRRMEWQEVLDWQPEVLMIACCGLDLSRSAVEVQRVRELPGFGRLPCAAAGRLFVLDGQAYVSRPGPRLIESLELLAHLLHPEEFPDRPGRAAAMTLASFTT